MRCTRTRSALALWATLSLGLVTAVQAESSEEIEWVTRYNQARQLGSQSDRPVLLFVTTDGCRHCVRMKRDAFCDRTIIDQIQQSFVPAMLKLDASSELARQLRVTIYPTTVIISPNGRIIDYARGYLSTQELSSRMSVATSSAAKNR
jgi:protein disulfide-isomerase